MALVAQGAHKAAAMLANLDRFRDETGAYWMGMQVEQHVFGRWSDRHGRR